jgi:hypothetical protein
MSQKLLRNRIIELGEEDEEELLGPYGQGLAEDMENDSQEAVTMQEQPIQAVEASSKNPPTPEPAPSTSVESTTGVSGGQAANDVQLLMQMLHSFQQKQEENNIADKKEQEERQQILQSQLEKNQRALEEKLEKNQQKQEERERHFQQKQEQILQSQFEKNQLENKQMFENSHRKL